MSESALDIFTDSTRADVLMRLAWDPDGTLVILLKEPMDRVQFLADEIPLVRQFLEHGP